MLVSKKPGVPNAIANQPSESTNQPNATVHQSNVSGWNIGHVGAWVGHVDFTFFVSISFALDANTNAFSGGIWALGVD